VVVALGEPGAPVISCATAGVKAKKQEINIKPEKKNFPISNSSL
jgi:hypothetical protein